MRSRFSFARRGDLVDDYGNTVPGAGPWETMYECAARLQPVFGSRLNVEEVSAARLSARQPYNLIVRNCAAARAIRTDWRVVDARSSQDANGSSPRVFNIKTIVDPMENSQWLEMLVVEGEAS
jgi:hypothetical protein